MNSLSAIWCRGRPMSAAPEFGAPDLAVPDSARSLAEAEFSIRQTPRNRWELIKFYKTNVSLLLFLTY